MKNNKLLQLTYHCCNLFCVLLVIFFLAITLVTGYWFIYPGFTEHFDAEVAFPFKASLFGYTKSAFWNIGTESVAQLTVANLNPLSVLFNYLQLSAIFLLTFLCFREFAAILRSLRLRDTFQQRNVQSFSRIGNYLLFTFILSSFWFAIFKQGYMYSFHISLTIPVLMFLAYVLAQVFKEGNQLFEENELTV